MKLAAALIVAAAVLLVTACTTQTKVVTVQVPVKCTVPAVVRPDLDTLSKLPAGAEIDDMVLALLDDRERAHGYIGQLESVVAACQ